MNVNLYICNECRGVLKVFGQRSEAERRCSETRIANAMVQSESKFHSDDEVVDLGEVTEENEELYGVEDSSAMPQYRARSAELVSNSSANGKMSDLHPNLMMI
jgi:hypothetical protein